MTPASSSLRRSTSDPRYHACRDAKLKLIREQLIGCTSTQCREDCKRKLTEIARQNLNDREFRTEKLRKKEGIPRAPCR